ncbi:hypothetical protein NG895_24130 [Aeoliella sp. ICT_H6.2]|uniref:DUF7901 domain-containing protein n=1 Tax=Aeoliella straminimaris TaxID=2954799 RepID=A0A9X2FHK9_9BACT|nr:hypothetical protein [Aeoliella straminimaris]MCO6046999.1 hypothetical protein [Aeoliella straminimaris]
MACRGIGRFALVIALTLGVRATFAAATTFFQAPLNGGDGFQSELETLQVADNFLLGTPTKITSLRWWGVYATSAAEVDDFTIRFFHDDSGDPELEPTRTFEGLAVSRSDSGLVDAFDDTVYVYEATLPTSVIQTGNSVGYVSILNSPPNGWFWLQSDTSNSNWFRFDDQDIWVEAVNETTGDLAFELAGVTPPVGDYNADFVVDHKDYTLWKDTFGSTTLLAADGNGDNHVDLADYVVWRNNLGASAVALRSNVYGATTDTTSFMSGTAHQTNVPEPSAVKLLYLCILLLLVRSRFKNAVKSQRFSWRPSRSIKTKVT